MRVQASRWAACERTAWPPKSRQSWTLAKAWDLELAETRAVPCHSQQLTPISRLDRTSGPLAVIAGRRQGLNAKSLQAHCSAATVAREM